MSSRRNPPEHAPDNPDADPIGVGRIIALRSLEHSARSRHDLHALLLRRNVPEDATQAVLDRLTELGLIDDREFARQWVQQRQAVKGLGRHVLRMELRRHGIADDLIAEAVDGLSDEVERCAATQLATRRNERLRGLDPVVRRRRLTSYLQRKGYGYDIVASVTAELFESCDD